MIRKICMLLVIVLVSGCSPIRLPGLPTPKKPEKAYSWKETVRTKPRAVMIDANRAVVVEETEQTLTVELEQTSRKTSFGQRVGGWISGMGILGILLLIAGLFLAPAATMGFLVKQTFKFKNAFRETVLAVKEAKATDNMNLKNSLSAKQSNTTKKLVADIKRET